MNADCTKWLVAFFILFVVLDNNLFFFVGDLLFEELAESVLVGMQGFATQTADAADCAREAAQAARL
jgi:hypothetical protein